VAGVNFVHAGDSTRVGYMCQAYLYLSGSDRLKNTSGTRPPTGPYLWVSAIFCRGDAVPYFAATVITAAAAPITVTPTRALKAAKAFGGCAEPCRRRGAPSSNVDGRFCCVHGAGGLELDEQPPVAGGRELDSMLKVGPP